MNYEGLKTAMLSLLDMAEEALPRPAGRVQIAPGSELAWDNCCEGGGQLSLRLVQLEAAPGAPKAVDCPPPFWRVQLGLSILRCTPTVNDRGIAPSAGQLTDNAMALLEDTEAMHSVLQASRVRDLVWTPLGPEGGCAGGEWTFSVRIPNCNLTQE